MITVMIRAAEQIHLCCLAFSKSTVTTVCDEGTDLLVLIELGRESECRFVCSEEVTPIVPPPRPIWLPVNRQFEHTALPQLKYQSSWAYNMILAFFFFFKSYFTDSVNGSHLLWKLLLGLGVLSTWRLSWGLRGLSLSGGLAAVRQTKCCVGSLHGAGVYRGWGVDVGSTWLAHANRGHGVLETRIWGTQHGWGEGQNSQSKKNII